MRGITLFEHRTQKVVSRAHFASRMLIAIGLWLALTAARLAIGIAGYSGFEGMSLTDAFVNAAMILSGLGLLASSIQRRENCLLASMPYSQAS